jgi:L-seryl-tRNA(Ser) seleniumtransferase
MVPAPAKPMRSTLPSSLVPADNVAMASLDELGVRPLINAAGAYTMYGGSRLAPGVAEAMVSAGDSFVELEPLQRRVGARIAELTGNEACYVATGAAAGVAIAVAACVAGVDPIAVDGFPIRGEREVIVQRAQRNGYDYSARMTGVRLVEIGGANTAPTPDELRAAINPATACVLVFTGSMWLPGTLPLPEVIAIAHDCGVPVIVDAAGQVPPKANLSRFTAELGADLAVFSGGKGLRGPQTTGLVLGRAEMIEACFANASPRHAIGRPMKVGKEELLGILTAVEWTMRQDETALFERWERMIARWVAGLDAVVPGVSARRDFPGIHDEVPQCVVRVEGWTAAERDAFIASLKAADPPLATRAGVAENEIQLNPMMVREGESMVVLETVRAALTGATH